MFDKVLIPIWLQLILVLVGLVLSIYAEILRNQMKEKLNEIEYLENIDRFKFRNERNAIDRKYGTKISRITILAVIFMAIGGIISSLNTLLVYMLK